MKPGVVGSVLRVRSRWISSHQLGGTGQGHHLQKTRNNGRDSQYRQGGGPNFGKPRTVRRLPHPPSNRTLPQSLTSRVQIFFKAFSRLASHQGLGRQPTGLGAKSAACALACGAGDVGCSGCACWRPPDVTHRHPTALPPDGCRAIDRRIRQWSRSGDAPRHPQTQSGRRRDAGS